MREQLSSATLAEILKGESDIVIFSCVKMEHAELPHPYYFVNSENNLLVQGNLHIAAPFTIKLPGETEETIPQVTIEIDNVDSDIIDTVRSVLTPPTMSFYVVSPDEPDHIQAGPFKMKLREVSYDFQKITGTCRFRDLMNLNFPYHTFTPARFPGLF